MKLETYISSKPLRITLIVIAILIVLLLVFRAGILMGYHKASFSYRWSENYHRNFGGPRMGFMNGFGMRGLKPDRDFIEANGVVGQVMKIQLPTFVMEGKNGMERIVSINDNTKVKRANETITPTDINVNDFTVVVGDPNEQGQIVAKLIRLLPPPPTTTGSGMMLKTPLSQPYFRPF